MTPPKLRLLGVTVQPIIAPVAITAAQWDGFSSQPFPGEIEAFVVQPHLVLDDGNELTPVDQQAIQIPAAEWPTYSGERFPAEVKALQAALQAEPKPPRTRPKR